MAHPGGRPTKYKERYCKDVIEYYSKGTYENYPTTAGFCSGIKISKDTLFQWCKDHPQFSDSYHKACTFAEDLLLKGAMNGRFNANFSKFVGQNFFGLTEKTEVKNDTTLNIPTGINITFVKGEK